MGIAVAIGLIVIAIALFVAALKKWIPEGVLGTGANVAGIVALLAAIILFVVPPARQTEPTPRGTERQPTPTNTTVPVSTSAATAIPTATITKPPELLPSSTAVPQATQPPTVASTTVPPIAMPPSRPQPESPPVGGGPYNSPIYLKWRGALSAGQLYQVTVYVVGSGNTEIVLGKSGLLATPGWCTNLGMNIGEVRWRVAVISNGKEAIVSPEAHFYASPLGKSLPPGCSAGMTFESPISP